MLHVLLNDDVWFEQKRYGLGAGWPVAWQGWALLAAYVAAVFGSIAAWGPESVRPLLVIGPATLVLILISRRHTRGGWRWRWGGRDA